LASGRVFNEKDTRAAKAETGGGPFLAVRREIFEAMREDCFRNAKNASGFQKITLQCQTSSSQPKTPTRPRSLEPY
jgi:hypothetical protein